MFLKKKGAFCILSAFPIQIYKYMSNFERHEQKSLLIFFFLKKIIEGILALQDLNVT
jgi:hypothetical protein